MRNFKQILIELIVLAILTVILIYPIKYITKMIVPSENGEISMIVGSIILICGVHVLFEIIGLNEYWCKTEYPLNL